ncbi:MAG TPA: glucokinase [Xanthomonadaceae bacterium]|nr:glucokinase [Xanthomonadaceae bacterium]
MNADLALIADIGGTNARFALADLSAREPGILQPASLCNADFASLQHAASHYLQSVGARPKRAAIAVASPIAGDDIHLTNRAWSFGREELRMALGLDELRLLNDFGAIGWAVPALHADERIALYGRITEPMVGPITLIGPGTGLGVGLLVGSEADGWRVVETEGGHVSFAPQGDEEQLIARWFTARHGRVSNERVLCGKGLSQVDAILRGAAIGQALQLREPADIVEAALGATDVSARRALARFCAVLGSVAGDCALVHGARTVVIAGGMVPRFVPFLRSSAFRERFLAKGRFAAWLESVAIHVITHPHPGLLGAAVALRQADAP